MYPRNAATPPRIAVGPVVLIATGAVQTSDVLIKVTPEGGAAAAGEGTTSYVEGIVHYVPTQAETNYTAFTVTAYKADCIPIAVTVVTTASATAGIVICPDTQKVDVHTIKTQTVTAAAGVTVPASIGTSTYAGADTAGTTTLLSRIVGTLAAGTHTAQSGDAYAIANSGTHGNAALKTLIDAVDTVVDAILLDTGTDGVVVASGSKTGYSLAADQEVNVTKWGGTAVASANVLSDGAITAAKIAASALDGKGNWNVGKTGYSLTAEQVTALVAAIEAEIADDATGEAVKQAIIDKLIENLPDLDDLTLSAIGTAARDAILNRALSGNHDTAGTVGKVLQDILEDTGTTLPGTLSTITGYVDCLPASWVVPSTFDPATDEVDVGKVSGEDVELGSIGVVGLRRVSE